MINSICVQIIVQFNSKTHKNSFSTVWGTRLGTCVLQALQHAPTPPNDMSGAFVGHCLGDAARHALSSTREWRASRMSKFRVDEKLGLNP
jgi:hypothetical protein